MRSRRLILGVTAGHITVVLVFNNYVNAAGGITDIFLQVFWVLFIEFSSLGTSLNYMSGVIVAVCSSFTFEFLD